MYSCYVSENNIAIMDGNDVTTIHIPKACNELSVSESEHTDGCRF